MSSAIIVTLLQCSGLKATEMQHHHHPTPPKRKSLWKYLYMEIPTFYIEEVLLCFLRRSCFSSTNKFCVRALLTSLTRIWWPPQISSPIWSLGQSASVCCYLSFTHTASTHRRLRERGFILHDKPVKPLHNNAILYWPKAHGGL